MFSEAVADEIGDLPRLDEVVGCAGAPVHAIHMDEADAERRSGVHGIRECDQSSLVERVV
jgi:hypothetical protein